MALASGFRLGVYEILGKLGEGGMGEVYRARDTRLKRDVAIKVLPEDFARDPDRRARFEREAELLATLNHPNIAGIYGFEEQAPVSGIVLELVDGPTLSDRIAAGPLPLDEAVSIARQVADALEAAHDKGVVHRDLKPGNIKVTSGGQVKVLDFGLAKAMESAAALRASGGQVGLSLSPTVVSPATQAGIVLGTAAYMSPEQARGKAVDQRADIWAFGCVLFEMCIGRSPFGSNETVSDAIAAVLTREPQWEALPPETPASVRRLLRRCLEKDANRRLHHIADARLELEDTAASEPLTVAPAPAPPRWRTVLPWAVAVVALGLAAFPFARPDPNRALPRAGINRLELNLPADLELYTSARTVALSPDASGLAFIGIQTGARHVYLRRFDQFDVTALPGTDNASMCFFSADGRAIGFVTSSGILKTISLADRVVTTVADEVSFLSGAAWHADGTIVIARANTLWTVPRGGGALKPLTTLDEKRGESRHAWPLLLPGGRTLLFGAATGDRWRIEAMDLSSGVRRAVVESGTLPMYTSGQLAFVRDGQVLAAPFDSASAQLTGAATPLIDNVPLLNASIPLVDISLSGTVVFSPTVADNRLVWVSRDGKEEVINDNRRGYTNPRISPDGQRIVVQAGDLWMQDLARGTFSRLTNGQILTNGFPIWLPDGHVMYRSQSGLRTQGLNGPGDGERVISGTTELDYPGAVAPDGDTLIFFRSSEPTSFDILALSLRDPSKTTAVVRTPAYESGVKLSPDGRWLTYVSNETGRNEIYITSYPGMEQRLQVSTQGGTQAIWNPSGHELFYRIDDKMMAVDVATAPLKLSTPRVLFEGRYAYGAGITIPNFDVSRDGKRFLMVKPETGAGRLNVVQNWFAERGPAR